MKYTFLTQTLFHAKYLLCLRTLKILISKNYKFVNKNLKKVLKYSDFNCGYFTKKKKGQNFIPTKKTQLYGITYFNMSLKCAFEDILGGMYLCTVGGCLTGT